MADDTALPGIHFSAAMPELLPAMVRLLTSAGLPADDLPAAQLSGFELALDRDGRLVGMAGLDRAGNAGLLRSVAVLPEWRRRGLGACLVARRETAARAAGIRSIYLLTISAEGFFLGRGYGHRARKDVPAEIAAHPQFQNLCPASARCLGREL